MHIIFRPLSLRTAVTNSRTEFEKRHTSYELRHICHITACFEVIRGFSHFLQALVDIVPLEQATDALLMYLSCSPDAIRRYITAAVRTA